MEKSMILMIILGALLITLCVADYVLDRIIISRRKKFAVEINDDIEEIQQKISEIEDQISISEASLLNLKGEQRDKCLAELGRLRINLANLRKGCERICF